MEKIRIFWERATNFANLNLHLNLHSYTSHFVLLLVWFLLISFLTNYFLVNSFLGTVYRIFVAPGVILHELSHALFCLITGAKITKISFFEKDGGSVEHTESKLPILGSILISSAPFFIGLIAIFFMARKLGLREVDLNAIKISYDSVIHFTKTILSQIDYHQRANWIVLYLAFSVLVTMTPSKKDLGNMTAALFLSGIVLFLIHTFIPFHINFGFVPVAQVLILLDTIMVLLILMLVLSMILYVLSKIAKK